MNHTSNLDTLSRPELVALAKKNGIPGNLSNAGIKERLTVLAAPATDSTAPVLPQAGLRPHCIGSRNGKDCVYMREGSCGISC